MNIFNIATAISFVILLFFIFFSVYTLKKPYRSSRLLTPTRILALGVFLAAIVIFIPHYWTMSSLAAPGRNTAVLVWETFWASVHHTIRLFVIDVGFDDVSSFANHNLYTLLGTTLYILAPIMTAGVILSFFQNFFSYLKCFIHPGRDLYVFSELSEKSLALAQDLKKNHKNTILIFTDVFEENNEENYEIRERAKELGAICFQKDITTLNLRFVPKSGKIHFFAIGENEVENVKQAFALSKADGPYANRENVALYVFSSEVQSELLLENIPYTKIRVRRINDIRSLVWHDLYTSGDQLFQNAIPEESGKKCIRAFVVGTGGHGTEMIKALSWFCQMDGYRVEIHAFDVDKLAEERFRLIAPDLMNAEYNGVYVAGKPECSITFHSGISVDSAIFTRELLPLGAPSYIFVSTGEDARNVRTAVLLRQFYRQQHMGDPAIRAIVYDTRSKATLNEAKNWKNQSYGIEFIGDLAESYSEDVILRQALEIEALATHKGYGGSEEEFYRFEYNYRSSMASALHRDLRRKLGICYFEKGTQLTEEQRHQLEVLEHKRWNAYMRSEGFVYSGSDDASSRDDLAKMHHNLVPFERLSEEDKRKDSAVAVGK